MVEDVLESEDILMLQVLHYLDLPEDPLGIYHVVYLPQLLDGHYLMRNYLASRKTAESLASGVEITYLSPWWSCPQRR